MIVSYTLTSLRGAGHQVQMQINVDRVSANQESSHGEPNDGAAVLISDSSPDVGHSIMLISTFCPLINSHVGSGGF